MENNFETEVLTRLAVIENKLDDYNSIKEETRTAYNISNQNKEDIKEINNKIQWLSRTILGAILTGIVGVLFTFLKFK